MRKILVPIANFESCQTALALGGHLSDQLSASLTVLHTFTSPSQSPLGSDLASSKLAEWGIDPPQVKLLNSAQDVLSSQNILKLNDNNGPIEKHSPKAVQDGLYEMHLLGKHDQDVRFRLRNGKPVQEIIAETEDPLYDLVIMGTRGHKGLKKLLVGSIAQQVALRSPCSILVAKNLENNQNVLVGVTGRETSLEAVRQAAVIAKALDSTLKLLAIIPDSEGQSSAEANIAAATSSIERLNVKVEQIIATGDPTEQLITTAGNDHILVLGRAKQSRMKDYFLGDLSLKILDQSECPVLITSYPRPLDVESEMLDSELEASLSETE